jgi:hypothetical protein
MLKIQKIRVHRKWIHKIEHKYITAASGSSRKRGE